MGENNNNIYKYKSPLIISFFYQKIKKEEAAAPLLILWKGKG